MGTISLRTGVSVVGDATKILPIGSGLVNLLKCLQLSHTPGFKLLNVAQDCGLSCVWSALRSVASLL